MANISGYLSRRGNVFAIPTSKLPMLNFVGDLWHQRLNPSGFLSLGVSENTLMHSELAKYLKNKIRVNSHSLTYGDGFSGSHRLRDATANFLNQRFHPVRPVVKEHIAVTSGVGPALELCGFSLCDPHDGILLGRPFSGSLPSDVGLRAKVKIHPVSFGNVDPFSMGAIDAYEAAMMKARSDNRPVRALLLCSPHNPLGRCYPRDVLKEYMRFCQRHQIHLISDEIYALSVWQNSDVPDAAGFTSVLSIDTAGIIDPSLVHVLWGMSKDFGANGLRVGYIVSQANEAFLRSLETNSYFASASALADRASARLLSDGAFVDAFVDTNRIRLATNYQFTTRFLDANNIPYSKGSNAGFFMWANLLQAAANIAPPTTPRHLALKDSWAEEARLQKALIQHKVFLCTGTTYGSESPGWFRIAFAHEQAYLQEGLDRIVRAIRAFNDQKKAP